VALESSLHTVRTHLKRIYAKTGTHRQASLVALLVNVVGAMDTEVN
jgi:DNA-binding CsgD family transcriptional regulator